MPPSHFFREFCWILRDTGSENGLSFGILHKNGILRAKFKQRNIDLPCVCNEIVNCKLDKFSSRLRSVTPCQTLTCLFAVHGSSCYNQAVANLFHIQADVRGDYPA